MFSQRLMNKALLLSGSSATSTLRSMQAASMHFQATNSYLSRHQAFSTRVFVQGLPSAWDESDISSRFSLAGALSKVHLVRNAAGQKTGKVVLDYNEKSGAEEAI